MLSGSREITCGKILIVDDDEAIRETLSQVLELSGFDSITSSNGQEALALLRSSTPPCLVLLDLMMPIMNGWAFMDAVLPGAAICSRARNVARTSGSVRYIVTPSQRKKVR